MNTATGHLTIGQTQQPTQAASLAHLEWVAGLAILGLTVPAVFVGVFQLPRNIYLVFYFGLMGALLYGYARWSRLDLKKLFTEHWAWGLIGGALLSVFTVNTVLTQPGSPAPQGLELGFDLAWLGVLYGATDALVLSIMPVYATWQALDLRGLTKHWPGRIATGVLAILASMVVIALYHLGYPECRGPQVVIIIVGVSMQSLGYLLTRSPWTPLIGHMAMHIAAVLYGLNTVSQLPPHY
jgi:hypothetical protein